MQATTSEPTAVATESDIDAKPTRDLDAPMTVEEAAEWLRLEPDTLHRWRRKQNDGPAYSMLGDDAKTVRYTLRDLLDFMQSRRKQPKSKRSTKKSA